MKKEIAPIDKNLEKKILELTCAQKYSFDLLMGIPPFSPTDKRIHPSVALNLARSMTHNNIEEGIKALEVYRECGNEGGETTALLLEIFNKTPKVFLSNKYKNERYWEQVKEDFPPGSYIQHPHAIYFDVLGKIVSLSYTPNTFKYQVKIAKKEMGLKDDNRCEISETSVSENERDTDKKRKGSTQSGKKSAK